jgi:hypothetical protein
MFSYKRCALLMCTSKSFLPGHFLFALTCNVLSPCLVLISRGIWWLCAGCLLDLMLVTSSFRCFFFFFLNSKKFSSFLFCLKALSVVLSVSSALSSLSLDFRIFSYNSSQVLTFFLFYLCCSFLSFIIFLSSFPCFEMADVD